MKANIPLFLVPLGAAALLSACAAPPPPPPVRPPVVQPRLVPGPPPLPVPVSDWRDAVQTPGNWRWANENGRSTARFVGIDGNQLVMLQCDRTGRTVWLARPATGSAPVRLMVRTTGTAPRALNSADAPAPGGWIGVQLAPQDPLLDAIAFSRGRFALETAGLETLYLPAWPELSRVIEDCR